MQRLKSIARLHVELWLTLGVQSEILYAERQIALACLCSAHSGVFQLRTEHQLLIFLYEVAHHDVLSLACSDELRYATCFLAIGDGIFLCAYALEAISASLHKRREHLLLFGFGHLRERCATEILHKEEF